MKRVRLLFAATLAVSTMVVVTPPAHACDPEHQNPCDIQPYEVPDLYCKVLKKCG